MKLDLNALATKMDSKWNDAQEEVKVEIEEDSNDIAVIGIACKIAASDNKEEYWNHLKNGTDCIRPFPQKRQKFGNQFLERQDKYDGNDGYYEGGFLSEVDLFDHEFFGVSPVEADLMSPDQRNFIQIAWSALEDAGYGNGQLSTKKAGIYLGHSSDFGVRYKEFIDILNPDMQTFAISGNLNSIIGSRLAYVLDLKGPSVNIDTACSSALVAIHSACHALKNGDCDVAIAGSSKIDHLPLKSIKKLEDELGITSPDGRTRTFDFDSNGTGLGEGIGAIVLKPLQAAKKDRDHIYAVIKGSAVNQDGKSANLTSPNPRAQEEVILKAWQNACVNPEKISYIEAHGTATKLGDPIEVEGITRAFRHYTDKKQFCAIGSVKSNIGHLDNAAGIAGIIKVIMSLEHKELPRSLHYKKANEKIDFTESPLYVNAKHSYWKPNGDQRLCGISAFGLSGTNCHIVLGEAEDENKEVTCGSDWKVLSISAKCQESLIQYIWEYQQYLYHNKEVSLDSLCYTVNTGRKQFHYRLAVVFKNKEELQEKLQAAYLYQKSQQDKGIYYGKCEKVMSDSVKEAEELLAGLKERKEKPALEELQALCQCYQNGVNVDWSVLYQDASVRKISLPTYPFQRKSHWVTVDNTKSLVKTEPKVIKEHPLVHECIADSIDTVICRSYFNVPDYWVLNEHIVDDVPVIPGTTYIEMAYEVIRKHYRFDAVELFNIVFLNPLVLNEGEQCEVHTILKEESQKLTFTVASKKTSEEQWIIHAKGRCLLNIPREDLKVNLEDVKTSLPDRKLKEYPYEEGKGIKLSERWNCIEEIYTDHKDILAYLTLKPEYQEEGKAYSLHPALLDEAANVALRTVGEGLYLPFSYKKMEIYEKLPNEIFAYIKKKDKIYQNNEMASYDILLTDKLGNVCIKIEEYTIKKVDFSKIQNEQDLEQITYYTRQWFIANSDKAEPEAFEKTIVLYRKSEKASEIAEELKQKLEVTLIPFEGSPENYQRLASLIKEEKNCHVINLCPLALGEEQVTAKHELLLNQSVYESVTFVKTLVNECSRTKVKLTMVGSYANLVTGEEPDINPWAASCLSLGNALYLEHRKLSCKSIDVDSLTQPVQIVDEILSQSNEREVAFRNQNRYVQKLIEADKLHIEEGINQIQDNGVYVITGGAGSLGLETARHLSQKAKVSLELLNRSEFPKRDEWDDILKGSGNTKLKEKIDIIKEIESHGSRVNLHSADITDESALQNVIQKIRTKQGKINGVIHAAGVAGDAFLMNKTKDQIRNVIGPKVIGTILLDKLTKEDNLDFFVMFSSISSVVPEAGQLDYSAANRFMDSYSSYRNQRGSKTIAINWPAFLETGMAVDHQVDFEKELFQPIYTREAMLVLDRGIAKQEKNWIVGKVNASVYEELRKEQPFSLNIENGSYRIAKKGVWKETGKEQSVSEEIELTGSADGYSKMEKELAYAVGNALGITTVNIRDGFQKLGGNSILAIKVQMILEDKGIDCAISDLLSYGSLKELAAWIGKEESKDDNSLDVKTLDSKVETGQTAGSDIAGVQLKEVEPFTDIIYKGCFFSAAIPAILHFGKSIDGLVFHDIISYQYEDENNIETFGIHYEPIEGLDDCVNREGIVITRKEKSETIISDLEASIEQGNPVIVSIDSMYESISTDCYQKEHWPHNILVYGYNKEEQLFYIIEHRSSVSTYYEKMTISYQELKECYDGFQEHFKHLDIVNSNLYDLTYVDTLTAPGAYIVSDDGKEHSREAYEANYFGAYAKKEELVRNGLAELEKFERKLLSILEEEAQTEQAADTIIELLNKIVTAKSIERYRYKKIENAEEIQNTIMLIHDLWDKVRNIIVKYSFSKVYTKKLASKTKAAMDEILEQEKKLYLLVKENADE